MRPDIRVLGIDELHKLTRTPRNGTSQTVNVDHTPMAGDLWACLVETVRSPTVSDKHMTAACNALCFVVRANSQGQDEALKLEAYDPKTWRQMFGAARSAFASGKNKPAIQILETLYYLAETNLDRASVIQNVEEAALEMVRVILSHRPRRSIKEACIVLYFFLRKLSDFMSFSDVLNQALNHERGSFVQSCHTSGIPSVTLSDGTHPQWFAFVLALLLAVRFTESKSATLKLLALLCELPTSTYEVDLPSILSKSIDVYSIADETALEAVTRDVLPSVLTNQDLFSNFFLKQQKLGVSSVSSILVVLILLQYGKSKGYVQESVLPSVISEYWLGSEVSKSPNDLYDSFDRLLSHGSASVRFGACELLLSSTSPNSPFPSGVLSCMTANLIYLHDDTDAYHRGELFSILRRFLARLQQSHRALETSGVDDTHRSIVLHEYERFYEQYLGFLRRELLANNSYPRHILALQILHLASHPSSSQENIFQRKIVMDQGILTDLFHLILDPYEDVRALAAGTIAQITQNNPRRFKHTVITQDPLTTVYRLAASTNRADHADALGRILSLVPAESSINEYRSPQESTIENLIQLSDQLESHILLLSTFNVSDSFPMHGVILGVKYTIERLRKDDAAPLAPLVESLLDICGKIWTLSHSHLCVDSPEMESESTENDDPGPKDSLAYAWRALRDSNLMMQAMLAHFTSDVALLERIGDTCLNQLALLRHRGAFSTVAQTFVLCCQRARDSKDAESHNLIDRWFAEAMNELERQADKLTRRSAGLPAIFAAVFDPSDKAKFSVCFQRLVEKAVEQVAVEVMRTEDNLRLPQVHALNCIKEIMTSSRFRVLTEPLVVFTLNLAANCMNSTIWAIKNCGLMLLRASINRLDPDTGLGNSEAGMKQRALSETERRPVDVAVDFLDTSMSKVVSKQAIQEQNSQNGSNDSTEALFAGLDILSRLYVETQELKSIKHLVAEQLGHPLWHVRAQAARLLVILTPHGMESALLRDQLSENLSTIEHESNRMHGVLMLSECLVQKLRATSAPSTFAIQLISLLREILKAKAVVSNITCMAKWFSVADQLLETTDMGGEGAKDLFDAAERVIAHPLLPHDKADGLYDRHLAAFGLRCHTMFGTMYAQVISQLRTCEDDVFTYTLATFRPHADAPSMLRYLEVLISLLEHGQTQESCAAIMQAFCVNLAQGRTEVDASRLARLIELLDFDHPTSRNLLNVQLPFYAISCLLAWKQHNTVILDTLAKAAGSFCLHLRTAANDEIEYDTRYSTIKALQYWKVVPSLPRMLKRLFEPPHQMDILSVLYDLLNDDDEEIRAEASEFTVALMDEHDEVSTSSTRSFCPAASRRQLRICFFREFGATQLLCDESLRRVIGKQMTVSRLRLRSENDRYLRHMNVSSELRPILESMRELFVEEKQNLYIDESAELEEWAAMLRKTAFSDDMRAMDRLAAWSMDGADQLNAIFKGKHSWSQTLFDIVDDKENALTDGDSVLLLQPRVMFGTSLTESLELLVCRVIVGLRLASKSESIAFKSLQDNCVRLNMSQAVLSAFTWSLG